MSTRCAAMPRPRRGRVRERAWEGGRGPGARAGCVAGSWAGPVGPEGRVVGWNRGRGCSGAVIKRVRGRGGIGARGAAAGRGRAFSLPGLCCVRNVASCVALSLVSILHGNPTRESVACRRRARRATLADASLAFITPGRPGRRARSLGPCSRCRSSWTRRRTGRGRLRSTSRPPTASARPRRTATSSSRSARSATSLAR